MAAYRIVQEALTNVSRHARASACTVRLACADGRALTIEIIQTTASAAGHAGGQLAFLDARAPLSWGESARSCAPAIRHTGLRPATV